MDDDLRSVTRIEVGDGELRIDAGDNCYAFHHGRDRRQVRDDGLAFHGDAVL
ncbi:hypothetical protein AB0B15_09390 [Streptomyces sp. NPDC045456]|uniref:hypothetical protein n=1 Tax=Streptomyces sp. NPDC045456 TaxID=3155254 RepID=UPI0033FA743A